MISQHYKALKWIFWKPGTLLAALIGGAPAGIVGVMYWLVSDQYQQSTREMIRKFVADYWQALLVWPLAVLIIYMYFKIHKLITPKIVIDFDDSYHRRGQSLNLPGYGVMQCLTLGIRSEADYLLSDCYVKLEDVVAEDGWRPCQDLPSQLERKDGNGPFPLRPGDSKLAYLAAVRQDDPQEIFLRVIKNGAITWEGVPDKKYTIRIGVYPANGKKCMENFKLYIDGSRTIRLERVD